MANPNSDSKLEERKEETRLAAGSYNQEIDKHIASANTVDSSATEPLRQGTLADKESPDTEGANPKRTENSRPS